MDPLAELLATDSRQTLEFFVANLRDVSEPTVDRQELLYNASMLAHFAQVPVERETISLPPDLSLIFDRFVASTAGCSDPLVLETAGAQCLLFTGFFGDQMRHRYNVHWYSELGASFFMRAAAGEESAAKARLLATMARHFEPWRRRHARLSLELRKSPYLISWKN
jgi:hypothetical protein